MAHVRSTTAAASNQFFFIFLSFFLSSLLFLCFSASWARAFSRFRISINRALARSFLAAALDVVGSSAAELLLHSSPVATPSSRLSVLVTGSDDGETDGDFMRRRDANFLQNRFNYNVKTVHNVLSRAGTALSMYRPSIYFIIIISLMRHLSKRSRGNE